MSVVPESVTRMETALERRRAEYESGVRRRIEFSCGCRIEMHNGKPVGVAAGKGCVIVTPSEKLRGVFADKGETSAP